jgi:hypothetical protein
MHDAARNAALVVEAATNSRPTYTQ